MKVCLPVSQWLAGCLQGSHHCYLPYLQFFYTGEALPACLSKNCGFRDMKKETSITNQGSQKQEFRRHSLAGDTAYLDSRYCFVLKRSGRVLESTSLSQTPSSSGLDPGPTHNHPWPELQALGRKGSGRPHSQHSFVMTTVCSPPNHPIWRAVLKEL